MDIDVVSCIAVESVEDSSEKEDGATMSTEKLEQELEKQKKILPEDHPAIAKLHYQMGKCYYERKDHLKAIEHLEPALEVQKAI